MTEKTLSHAVDEITARSAQRADGAALDVHPGISWCGPAMFSIYMACVTNHENGRRRAKTEN
jgi:hypothetical protein